MSGERMRDIRERAEAATPGPWAGEDLHGQVGIRARGPVISGFVTEVRWRSWYHPKQQQEQQANAAFIAHAREDVPWLLARVEELEAALRPFADMATAWDGCPVPAVPVRARHLKVARRALSPDSEP